MSERGFAAVRAKYGPEMVRRVQNWPRAALNRALMLGYDEESKQRDVAKAEQAVRRARHDVEYALEQAAVISRANVPDYADMDVQTLVNEQRRVDAEALEIIRTARVA